MSDHKVRHVNQNIQRGKYIDLYTNHQEYILEIIYMDAESDYNTTFNDPFKIFN
jgi:hypothetical protein